MFELAVVDKPARLFVIKRINFLRLYLISNWYFSVCSDPEILSVDLKVCCKIYTS